jgi:hypothetical protein
MGPVLLLDMSPVILVARPGAREGDLVLEAVGEQVGVGLRWTQDEPGSGLAS